MTTIEYVTHASLLFKRDDVTLLTDPFYWLDPLAASVMTHFPPRSLEPADFGPIRFLYSSHIHPDHSHPETLSRLHDRVGTVLLPAERPGLVQRYRDLGFTDIVVLANGQTVALTEHLRVTSYWSGTVDTCLVVDMGDTVAVHLNDCIPTIELMQRIAQRHRIDYAFTLYTSAQDLFPFLLPHTDTALQQLGGQREAAFLAGQIDRLKALHPRMVVPYSMTMTYFHPEQRHLNGYQRLIPPQFAQHVKAALPTVKCLVVQPGDVIDAAHDTLLKSNPVNYWGNTLDEYLANIARYADAETSLPAFRDGSMATVQEGLQQRLETFVQRQPTESEAFFYQMLQPGVGLDVVGEDGRCGFYVDVRNRNVRPFVDGDAAVLHITVPACIVAALLQGFYDPYSLLFMHRSRFRLHPSVKVTPEQESSFYIMAFMFMLCDNPLDFVSL